jgi:hypothetical protein
VVPEEDLIMRARPFNALVAIAAMAGLWMAGCSTNPPGDSVRAGHNTTFPPLPACLFFCFARVDSSIDTTNSINRTAKPGRSASAASAPQPLPTGRDRP